MTRNNSITAVPGLRVGQAQDEAALTGCTVILCEAGATGGVDQRGGAPGTRETDALHTIHLVEQVHGVTLAGGSAFGLDAAGGVARYLEERGVGFDVGVTRVPIVPAAILFDLGLGRADVRPGFEMGYAACLAATTQPPAEGNAGAGMGATVGKVLGMRRGMKAGVGSASVEICAGLVVGALAAVNAFGDVIDPHTGQIVAGARAEGDESRRPGEPGFFADTLEVLRARASQALRFHSPRGGLPQEAIQNTVIAVVATNARFNKEQANKLAQMAQDGISRTIRPAHTMLDGDTVFALATGQVEADVNVVGAFAAEALAQAVLRAVKLARSAGGVPGLADIT